MIDSMCRFLQLPASAALLFAAAVAGASSPPPPPAAGADNLAGHAQRAYLLERFHSDGSAASPVLIAALADERNLVRRTAAHLIVRLGSEAPGGLEKALQSPDFQVRRIAIGGILEQQRLAEFWGQILQDRHPSIRRDARFDIVPGYVDAELLPRLMDGFEEAYGSENPAVRLSVVEILTDLSEDHDGVWQLLTKASQDPDDDVRTAAFQVVITPTMERLQAHLQAREWQALVDRYGDSDFNSWPDPELARNALHLRAQAWFALGDGEKTRADLAQSVAISPDRRMLLLKARNAEQHLDDPQRALELYREAIETSVGFGGHLMFSSILGAANLLRAEGRYDEAIEVIERVNPDSMSGYWGAMMLEAYAQTLTAQGNPAAAIARYKQALALDGVAESLRHRLQQELDALGGE